jgi:hypothetical protein
MQRQETIASAKKKSRKGEEGWTNKHEDEKQQ